MPIDKSWMQISRKRVTDQNYLNGVEEFLNFAFDKSKDTDNNIRCPCVNCNNLIRKTRDEVKADLVMKGVLKNYTTWVCHGEKVGEAFIANEYESDEDEAYDDMHNLIMDTHGHGMHDTQEFHDNIGIETEEPNEEAKQFYNLLKDAEQELYPGCENYSRLSFIVKLRHIKCLNKWSDKSLSILLKIFEEVLPKGNSVPSSYYEAKKVTKGLGLDYIKIDACENDCVLYWKEHASAIQCPVCQLSRWRTEVGDNKSKRKPWKILRYFPLKDRLQRLFMSSKIAEFMRWHHEGRKNDGVLRHPADAEEWKEFDRNHESFASDSRNVRLGIVSDGFNPFGNMSIAHSTWPIVVVSYNLPPWMCMKQPYTFMSLLIPGPKGPGNDIDVYLRPLIDELKELWNVGVNTYDASKNQNFIMRAAVMWTINDFPAYANLSGWSTRGYKACPCCNGQTPSKYLSKGGKVCYIGHRQFLPNDHKWRYDTSLFNGKEEDEAAPKRLSGDDVLNQLQCHEQVTFGKSGSKPKLTGFGETHNWTKHSLL